MRNKGVHTLSVQHICQYAMKMPQQGRAELMILKKTLYILHIIQWKKDKEIKKERKIRTLKERKREIGKERKT